MISIIKDLIDVEGGYVNHPNDRGGPTKYGITLKTLATYQKEASVQDVKELTINTAYKIYKIMYWDMVKLDQVKSPLIQYCLFDIAIHSGPKQAVKRLQSALRTAGYTEVLVDGIIGPITLQATNRASQTSLCVNIYKETVNFYISICKRDPSQLVFLQGWLNRSYHILERLIIS